MYCTSCGSPVLDQAYVCLKCGALVKRTEDVQSKKSVAPLVLGIIAICFAVLSVIPLLVMWNEGNIYDSFSLTILYIFYLIPIASITFVLGLIGLILGIINKGKAGIILSAISLALAIFCFALPAFRI